MVSEIQLLRLHCLRSVAPSAVAGMPLPAITARARPIPARSLEPPPTLGRISTQSVPTPSPRTYPDSAPNPLRQFCLALPSEPAFALSGQVDPRPLLAGKVISAPGTVAHPLRAFALTQAFALRHYGVLGVARRQEPGSEDRPALESSTREYEGPAGDCRHPLLVAGEGHHGRPKAREGLGYFVEAPRLAALVGFGKKVAETALHNFYRPDLEQCPADRQAARGTCILKGRKDRSGGPRRGRRTRGENERQLAASLVPHRHGGVGDEHRGVGC